MASAPAQAARRSADTSATSSSRATVRSGRRQVSGTARQRCHQLAQVDRLAPLPRHAATAGCRPRRPRSSSINRDGKLVHVTVKPDYDPSPKRMLVGFTYATTIDRASGGPGAARQRRRHLGVTKQTVSLPARIFKPQQRKQISGVVGASDVTHQTFGTAPALRCICSRSSRCRWRDQPVPVPAARRRPHLLGAGRAVPRPAGAVQRDGARRGDRLRARDRRCS